MKQSSLNLKITIVLLVIFGVVLTAYRHTAYQVPFLPGKKATIWSVEAKITFEAKGKAVKATFSLPDSQPGFARVGERTASPGYGINFSEGTRSRKAEWSIREALGAQTLYYQVDMQETSKPQDLKTTPPKLNSYTHPEPEATAIKQLLVAAQQRSSDNFSLAQELIREFEQQQQLAQLLTQSAPRIQWLVEALNNAKVPVRKVNTLFLKDQRRSQALVPFLQVYSGKHYRLINPKTGAIGREPKQMIWGQQASSVIDLIGASGATVGFSMIEREVPLAHLRQSAQHENDFLNFSIHNLPLEEQALFKSILLMPVGVLIVVFMRIFIGIRTSGTFMPVLIALAFIQTSLLTGLIGFMSIVSLGLLLRTYLSQHNLLLVARIATVIMMVIFIIGLFTLLSFQIGLSEGIKVTFFPMIILAWTIERLSILWEEEGAKEVAIQGGGSLLVAVITFLLMNISIVKHLTFNFIGLQFIFMAVVLMSGSYTGYRLSELKRFKHLLNKSDND